MREPGEHHAARHRGQGRPAGRGGVALGTAVGERVVKLARRLQRHPVDVGDQQSFSADGPGPDRYGSGAIRQLDPAPGVVALAGPVRLP